MKKNPLEWTVFGISLALLAGVVGLLLHAHVTSGKQPPVLQVTLGQAIAQEGTYAVPLEVRNDGDTTAEAVVIEVVLSDAGIEERAETQLAFVPHGSRRRAWVTFQQNPEGRALRARVLGYQEP